MTQPAVSDRRYRIFVSHTSDGFTDHQPNGDGLIAYGMLSELAARGHHIDVAGTSIALRGPLPSNLRFHALPVQAPRAPLDRIRYAVAVRRLYNRLSRAARYDVVHQFNPVVAGLSLGFAAFAPPLVLGSYNCNWVEPSDGRGGGRARAFRALGRNFSASSQQLLAAAIIVTTEAGKDRIPLAPLLRRKITTIPHGIDIVGLAAGEPPVVADDVAPTILFLANLIARKGIFTLLDAFERVATRIEAVRLLIAGSGKEEEAVRKLVAASPHRNRIDLLGNVGRDEIVPTFRRASLYCLPSHGEPFGMSALEAMACGLPLVVTREGGLGEIVPDSGGRKVPSGDPQALADALEALLRLGGEERARMGAQNRAHIQHRFAMPVIADRLEAVYARVVRVPQVRSQPRRAALEP